MCTGMDLWQQNKLDKFQFFCFKTTQALTLKCLRIWEKRVSYRKENQHLKYFAWKFDRGTKSFKVCVTSSTLPSSSSMQWQRIGIATREEVRARLRRNGSQEAVHRLVGEDSRKLRERSKLVLSSGPQLYPFHFGMRLQDGQHHLRHPESCSNYL